MRMVVFVSAALACTALACAAFACAAMACAAGRGKAAGVGEPAGRIELPAPGRLPLVKEKATLNAFVPSTGFIADLSTDRYATWIEEAS